MYTLEQIGEFYKEMGLTSLSIKDGDFEISLSSQQTGYIPAPVMPAQPVPTVAEAMKMLNDITASQDGIVEEICAAKGDMVEYNQPLIKLKSMV